MLNHQFRICKRFKTALTVFIVGTAIIGNSDSLLKGSLDKLGIENRFRVQIFLDESGFSPGQLNGANSELTHKAAIRWIRSHEMSLAGMIKLSKSSVENPFRIYEATKMDQNRVGRVPFSLRRKSRQNALPYARLSECIAEKFHCDETVLTYLNPNVDIKTLKVGVKIKVPNVNPFEIEKNVHSQTAGRDANRILIVWQENILEVYNSNNTLIASFPVTHGGKSSDFKNGRWTVAKFTPNPEFRWDDSILKNGVPGGKNYLLPPGPNNPVGVLWMDLNQPDGRGSHIGIHGTNHPESVGYSHSSGCIRMTNWDVVKLANLISVDCPVEWSP